MNRALSKLVVSLGRSVGSAVLLSTIAGCGDDERAQPASTPGVGGTEAAGAGGTRGGIGGLSGAGGEPVAGGGAGSGSLQPLSRGAIAATGHGTCALDGEGEIVCWGLGDAVWPTPQGTFVELIDCGGDFICAVRADRTYTCFHQPLGTPGSLDYGPQVRVRALAGSRRHICVIDDAGTTSCGQAQVTGVQDLTPPANEQFGEISLGYEFACGIRVGDGSIVCWGSSGDESAECSGSPAVGQLAPPVGSFVAISSGVHSTCALDSAGFASCWGAGEPGSDPSASCNQGLYNFGQSDPPPDAFKSVSVDSNHACGIRMDGTVACWGAGTTDTCTVEVDSNCRQSLPPAGVFEQVAVGLNHSCAITSDRKVQCWGYDPPGEGRLTPPAEFQ